MKYIESMIDTGYGDAVRQVSESVDASLGIVERLGIGLDAFFESLEMNELNNPKDNGRCKDKD